MATLSSIKKVARSAERIIGADVREGEWRLVLLFFANLFLLLTAYYILKVIREPLILLGGGALQRTYARGLQAGLLVLLVPAYSALANRIDPARLVKWIMALFVASLGGFFLAGRIGLPIGFPFFVWLGVFSTLSIAQFWSLANDQMTEAEGKRLFPLVAVGGTVGGIAGAQFVARGLGHLTPMQMMLAAAGVLVACMGLTEAGHQLGRQRLGADPSRRQRDPRGGFALVLGDRYLLLIGVSVVVLNLITATGDYILAQMVTARALLLAPALRGPFIGAFYGDLQTWVTGLTALVQILFVARAFKAVGIGGVLFVMPLLVVTGYGLLALLPLLATFKAVKVAESTTDYSLQNTIQHALFLPTSVDAKYKAKSAIDTLSKRIGDLASTVLISLGSYLGFKILGFAVVNVLAGVLWVWLSVQLRRLQLGMVAVPQPAALPQAPPLERVA
jgi:AAA family ATP:ADP antiporter